VVDGEELEGEDAKNFVLLQFVENLLYFHERFIEMRIVVGSYSFMFVGYFIVIAQKLPFSVRLQVNTKAQILQICLKVIDRGFDDASSGVVVSQILALSRIALFVQRYDPFVSVGH